MTVNIEKMRSEMRWEARKFAASVVLAGAALLGAGVGLGNLIWAHRTPSPPTPIVIQLPPPSAPTAQ